MLQTGQVFNNRYKIISTLGEGGFGAVYKVWDDTLQRFCAIKENLQVSAEAQKQFKREAIMLANLNHPHLVRVTDYFIISDQGQYLVMDYVDGDDLHTILAKSEAPLPVDQSLEWIRQICDALIYIHGQNPPIIHRDIKPANIRITPQKKAVLVDFGLAKEFDDSVKTTMGARGLTPHFAAPEQYGVIGTGTDAQSDIYSLGVTLYCLLTYRVPPESLAIMLGDVEPPPPVKVINRNVPNLVSDAIQQAMQTRRMDRYKSVRDFKDALEGKLKAPALVKAVPIWKNSNKIVLSNGMEFMRVPAGEFLMGSDNGRSAEQPQHIVDIPYDYWMARCPITNDQYNVYLKSKEIIHPVKDWEKRKDHPIGTVTWYEAMEYCKWLNNLLKAELPSGMMLCLPTEAEWEKAARGTDGREYPWGNTFDKNKCNTQENNGYQSTPVASYSPHGDSPYGCSDMAGNVSEWTHSINKAYPYNPKDGREDEQKNLPRVTRGGADYLNAEMARCAAQFVHEPSPKFPAFGFRVEVSPVEVREPAIETPKAVAPNPNKLILSNDMEFMRVPAGKFLMGSGNGIDDNEKPQHTVDIPYDYWMARFPITNELYYAYTNAKGINHPVFGWEGKMGHPVTNVNWNDATKYCQWLNNLFSDELPSGLVLRLPTEAEWEKTARGIDGRKYPWGNEFEANNCNSEEGFKIGLTPVSLYSPHGDSPYGCADMAGNAWEWTHSIDKAYHYNAKDGRENDDANLNRILRGGMYHFDELGVQCTCRSGTIPVGRVNYIGFRVVVSTVLS